MKINLTIEQTLYLEKILKLKGKNFRAPYSRIKKILKAGVYFDDRSSYHYTPEYQDMGIDDKTTLNSMNIKYIKYIKDGKQKN